MLCLKGFESSQGFRVGGDLCCFYLLHGAPADSQYASQLGLGEQIIPPELPPFDLP